MDTQFIQEPVTVTVDLTGLPDETIRHVRELVDAARQGQEAGGPVVPAKTVADYRGILAHTATGSWSAEQFEEARKEMMGDWENKRTKSYGEDREGRT